MIFNFRKTRQYKFYIRVKNTINGLWKLWVKNCNKDFYAESSEFCQLAPNLDINPQNVSLANHTRIQTDVRVISSHGKVVLKKYSVLGAGCTVIPGAHIPTVGLPQFLSITHINDKDGCIIINEDVWVAANVTLLSHSGIGRGALVGAGSLVTKDVPPYAVVAGVPAKVVAARFTIDQILKHESILYPESERFSRQYLEDLFHEYFIGKKTIGTSEISDDDKIKLSEAKRQYGIVDYSLNK